MAGLANRVAVVTNDGELAESFWRTERIVALAASPDPTSIAEQIVLLLNDATLRANQAETGYNAHRKKFSIDSTIAVLLREPRYG